MASLKFFLVACVLVACAAAQAPVGEANPTDPTHGDEQITTNTKRDKKDVLLSTLTYPYVQPAAHLLKTVYPISAVSPISAIHPYYRTVSPYSYYPYYPYYPYYANSAYYLRK